MRRLLAVVFPILWTSAFAAPPVNDNYANATVISTDVASFNSTTADATQETGETLSSSSFTKTVWYRFVPTRNGSLTLAASSTIDIDASIYQQNSGGGTIFDLSLLAQDTSSSTTTTFRDVLLNRSVPIYIRLCSNLNANFSYLMSFKPVYSSSVVLTDRPPVLAKRKTLRGLVGNPADVTSVTVSESGAGRATNVRYTQSSGTFSFVHRRSGRPSQHRYRGVKATITAYYGSFVSGSHTYRFKSR